MRARPNRLSLILRGNIDVDIFVALTELGQRNGGGARFLNYMV